MSLRPPKPIPAPPIGDPLCLGHRCISSRYPARDAVRGVYLIDNRGRRYPPVSNRSDRSLTAELQPGQTATTRRIFTLSADARATGFFVDRGTGPAMRCLFIGGTCWFPAPPGPPVAIE